MIDSWVARLQEAASDDAVRVVVLTGSGRAFCAGVDLSVLRAIEPTPLALKRLLTERIHRVALALEDLDKPTIAAINGVAVGAGLDMALLCDMRIAARSARVSEGYIKVGLVPGDGGAWLLPRLVGPAKAMELLMTGDFVDAEEALRLGMVNRVVDDENLIAETYTLADAIAAAPPVQIAMIRRLVRQSAHLDLRTHFDLVSSHMGVVGSLDDYIEAAASFREGRVGRYEGR
jgi:enoyl-CoA hydratase/carnithine racemase